MLALDQKERLFKAIGYEPHRGQQEFHESPARFRVASCGRRYGKSTMAARDMEPELFIPDRMFWIVGPTYDLGEKEFRVIWQDLMVKQGLGRDKRIKKAYNKRSGDMYIEFPWNTRLEVRSADHPENLVGEALDGVIMSEAAKHRMDTWERFIRPALADKRGWATFCTTPEGHNWLYDLYLLGIDSQMLDWASWKLPSWQNTIVFPGGRDDPEIKAVERTTSREWFMQEYGAEFTAFVGKIYSEFDEHKHIVDYQYNPNWPNYLFIDWGFVNALCLLDVQISPSDDVYIWRETYVSGERLEQVLEYYKEGSGQANGLGWMRDGHPQGHHIKCAYGDAEDPEAVLTVNMKLAPCIALPEAKENWRAGVELVKRFLKAYETGATNDYGEPVTVPKLFVSRDCPNTIKEFQNYKMKPPSKSGLDPREAPEKKDDHAMDAIRYGLVHLYELGAKYHLEDVMDVEEYRSSKFEDDNDRAFTTQDFGDNYDTAFTAGMRF